MGKSEYDDNPPAAAPSSSPSRQGNTMALGDSEEERKENRSLGSINPADASLQPGAETEPDPDSRGPGGGSDAPSDDR